MSHPVPDRASERAAEIQSIRLFAALDIPEQVRRAVSEIAAQFRNLCGSAKWVNLASAHVTLKFIGWVPLAQVENIQKALAAVPTPGSFELRFAGLGFFPTSRRPRVFWVGMEGGERLPHLAAAIETSLLPLSIPKEDRAFRPHLTLARFADSPRRDEMARLADAVAARLSDGAEAYFGSARIDQFHLYQSVLKREGAEYTRLSSYQLDDDQ